MPLHHYHTNYTATHHTLTPCVTSHLHHLNGPNNISRHVVWAYDKFSFFELFNVLQMLPHHHCTTNTAAHLPITPCINQFHLHHLSGPNGMSKHVIWTYGNFSLNFFLLLIFIPWHQCQCCGPSPPTHFLHHPC